MALDVTQPEDGDGQTYGVKVSELAGHIRQLKQDLNDGKLQNIGDGDDYDTKVICNPDDSIDFFNNGVNTIKIRANGVIDFYKQSGFEARLTASQTIPTGTWTKINLEANWDLQGEFDNTNHRWTATEDGKYLVVFGLKINGLADGKMIYGIIKKNSNFYRPSMQMTVGGTNNTSISASAVIDINSGDYFELWGYHNQGADVTLVVEEYSNYMAVYKLA